jgi:hypothetical protein
VLWVIVQLLQRIQWINFEQKGWAPSWTQLLERLNTPRASQGNFILDDASDAGWFHA